MHSAHFLPHDGDNGAVVDIEATGEAWIVDGGVEPFSTLLAETTDEPATRRPVGLNDSSVRKILLRAEKDGQARRVGT